MQSYLNHKDEDQGHVFSTLKIKKIKLDTRARVAKSILEDVVEDGQEEGGCLAGPGLSASHQIPAISDDRDGVLLDWREKKATSKKVGHSRPLFLFVSFLFNYNW